MLRVRILTTCSISLCTSVLVRKKSIVTRNKKNPRIDHFYFGKLEIFPHRRNKNEAFVKYRKRNLSRFEWKIRAQVPYVYYTDRERVYTYIRGVRRVSYQTNLNRYIPSRSSRRGDINSRVRGCCCIITRGRLHAKFASIYLLPKLFSIKDNSPLHTPGEYTRIYYTRARAL